MPKNLSEQAGKGPFLCPTFGRQKVVKKCGQKTKLVFRKKNRHTHKCRPGGIKVLQRRKQNGTSPRPELFPPSQIPMKKPSDHRDTPTERAVQIPRTRGARPFHTRAVDFGHASGLRTAEPMGSVPLHRWQPNPPARASPPNSLRF